MPPVKNSFGRSPSPTFSVGDRRFADSLHAILRRHRAHCLETIKFGATPPRAAMTLAEWSRPAVFRHLLQDYGNALYREYPGCAREEKPLQSLWAQWYVGLLVPPLMLALLKHDTALDCSCPQVHVAFHSTGRPAAFYVAAQAMSGVGPSPRERMEMLLRQHLVPLVTALESFAALNAKLVWNNTGYLMHWFLGELGASLPQTLLADLQNDLFFRPLLADGGDNPLYRTVIPRGGVIQRRSCCQSYRIPGMEKCSSCTLNRA